jgi:hypothetical protein
MVRKHWYKPRFWAWWWQTRAPEGVRVGFVLSACVLGGGAGYLVAGRLSAARAATITTLHLQTVRVTVRGVTVERTLTVREKGRLIRTTVPVVHSIVTPGKTDYVTTTSTIYLTRNVTVPVTTTVTVSGRSQTVVQTQLVPTVVTHTNVVTRTNVITHQVTQTVVQVLTQ